MTEIKPKPNNRVFPDNSVFTDKHQPFEVIWKELSYRVKNNVFASKRLIINNISGYYKSGQIMAIMGPSGCGKSSLLGCLSGNIRSGLSGSITISTKQKMRFAFIAQDDYLDRFLTIYESLMYASNLKNGTHVDHKSVVENVINSLNINSCANNRPKQCSGGQKKRISIALELVSRPNILILDEPTSGLDTSSTWQLINTLIELAKQSPPLAVVATVHQPSAKLFNLFDSVYLMSYDGQCIYQGLPTTLVNHLRQNGLICPQFHNPSDFALEIATKEQGIAKVMLLSVINKINSLDLETHSNNIQPYRKYRTGSHVWTLTKRTFKQTIRNTFMLPIRVVGHVLVTALLIEFWGSDSGHYSGCADNYAVKDMNFVENFEIVSNKLQENSGFIYFLLLFIWFASIFAVLLTFPQEMNILLKEYKNGWYSCFSYYMSKVLVDLLFQITIPNISSIPGYLMTGQYHKQEWRIYTFAVICSLIAMSASTQGLFVGAWLMKWPGPAAFIGVILAFPMVLFSGFMIPIKDMPQYFRWISWANFMRFGFESSIVSVYGFDRCERLIQNRTDWTQLVPNDKLIKLLTSNKVNLNALLSVLSFFSGQSLDITKSTVLAQYDYVDNDLYYGIVMIIIILIIYKIITYLLLLKRVA